MRAEYLDNALVVGAVYKLPALPLVVVIVVGQKLVVVVVVILLDHSKLVDERF